MTFGDQQYLEAEPIAHYVGHPRAPWQAAIGATLRAAYFHGHQNARMLLVQPYGFNTRDYESDAATQRTVIATAAGFAGVARGYRRLPPGQTHLTAWVCYSPRSVNYVRVTCRFSAHSIADDETDIVTVQRDINADRTGTVGRFSTVNGVIGGWNSRAAAVAGAAQWPFTAGFPVYLERVELPLVDVPTLGGTRVRVLVEMRANQESTPATFNVPVHVQPLVIVVAAESRR